MEILAALKSMYPTKAPGLDGFHVAFYKKFWGILGADIINMPSKFLNNRGSSEEINKTFIVLIPKVKNAVRIIDFRPISLYNVTYKIIAKVLTNHLKGVLPSIIDEAPGRLITNNVIIAFDHWLQHARSGREKVMAIKHDINKAYDRVKWSFISGWWKTSKFPPQFLSLIMQCVMFVTFQVLITGEPSKSFTQEHRLQQGDPLSLFLLQNVSPV